MLALPLAAGAQSAPDLTSVLAARKAAIAAMHARDARSLELVGMISGAALQGIFHSWRSGDDQRYDENTGVRRESNLRLRGREYAVNENGAIRELRGLLLQRQRTEDFIESDAFVTQPQYDRFLGEQQLPGGRDVYAIAVAPPQGQPETVYLDRKTSMLDRLAYDDADGTDTQDYFDYKLFAGVLIAQRSIESNGDHAFDLTRETVDVIVDRPIAADVFTLPEAPTVQTSVPVTVPLEMNNAHAYVRVKISGRQYTFLLDSGAQAVVLDAHVAKEAGLTPQGQLEVAGARRTGGLGVAPLDSIDIGGVALPVRMVTVLDLRGVTGAQPIDGILGYPFFAAAEVKIDPDAQTMTFAKPGALKSDGTSFSVDSDRELVELQARINGTEGRFVIDTGNGNELLVYGPFVRAHIGLIEYAGGTFANNMGVGGSASAVGAIVDELDIGPYRFFNNYANVMLGTQGAFADRFAAGNIGLGLLKNFVLTFDLANAKLYAKPAAHFDDGRYRTVRQQ
ncbi:MAG TPA: aspartyl protease family protein [Candidatus Rubrimentiphilum sp.]|nr:aspartyl protease family protein [Candidatus Rubrimentiphilum sp.]